MTFIITGKINSGKTTRMLSIYNGQKAGDGFAIKKVFDNGSYIGQNIMRLSTGESKPFSRLKENIPDGWDETCTIGSYSFSKQGFGFAEKIIAGALEKGIEPVYIDEIGPLELKNKGFSDILSMALKNSVNLYVTVRENCLHAVIQKFGIDDFEIIRV